MPVLPASPRSAFSSRPRARHAALEPLAGDDVLQLDGVDDADGLGLEAKSRTLAVAVVLVHDVFLALACVGDDRSVATDLPSVPLQQHLSGTGLGPGVPAADVDDPAPRAADRE